MGQNHAAHAGSEHVSEKEETMSFHLHPAVLPVTALAIIGYFIFKPKTAKASVAEAQRNLGIGPSGPTTPLLLSSSPSPTAKSTQVLTAQRALNVLGATPALKEDGIRGPLTTQALKDFQKKMNLAQTGEVDAATSTMLQVAVTQVFMFDSGGAPGSAEAAEAANVAQVATSGFWSDFASALGLSSDTMSIKDVQHSLNALGATPHLTEDGIKGPVTMQAIKDFQMHQGLTQDGVVGPETASALRYLVAAVNPDLQKYVDISSPKTQYELGFQGAVAGDYRDAMMLYGPEVEAWAEGNPYEGVNYDNYAASGYYSQAAYPYPAQSQVAGYGYPVAGYTSQTW